MVGGVEVVKVVWEEGVKVGIWVGEREMGGVGRGEKGVIEGGVVNGRKGEGVVREKGVEGNGV